MGNPKQFTPPSFPTLSASGNDENLSESKRNSDQRSKKHQQYMAPTNLTASKIITTPKKNNNKMIFAEWKPPTPTKSAPTKTPSFSEDETFVTDSTTLPYDPLTNYLSPRPKYLRYNPNKKRIIAVRKSEKGDSDYISNSRSLTDSPTTVPLDCQSSCTVNEIEGNLEEEDEEEENRVGGKRALLNWLVVMFGLALSTVYISTMNRNIKTDMNSNSPVIFTNKLAVQDLRELSLEMVSLRGKWGFDVEDESVVGVSEKFDAKSEVSGKSDAISEVSEKSDAISEISEVSDSLQDHSENSRAAQKERDYGNELDMKKVEIEVPIPAQSEIVLDPSLVTQEENLVDFKVRVPDFVSVVETVVEAPMSESTGVESEIEVKCLVLNAPIAEVRVPDIVTEVTKPEIKGVESVSEVKNAAENGETDRIRDANISEVYDKEVRLPKLTYIWLVGLTVMFYVVYMVASLSRKCRRVFTRSGPIRRRLNPQAVREEQTRLVGLPPRVGLDPIHQMFNCIVNTSTPSEGVVPRENKQESEMPRRIPTARPLGEVNFGGGFSGAVGIGKVVVREESVFTVLDERSAKRSKMSFNSDSAMQVVSNL